ncbi:cytochrome b561 and DOMON domain-containing protein At5g47530-like [Zingiber officinale]|uniref:Cytochrome b561 and DOMON domain-containing protein n=1 Tax=Zingiber officinale TaxID=94328 RepID=A0A8J5KU96_ZINOF|nr:cytochrome b561 and DOMON domain-containing protein At5g47530-like [Zingiber officinale]KAG6489888.1 hypothetical protein ZIOFF_051169 [Zingiber officinale]
MTPSFLPSYSVSSLFISISSISNHRKLRQLTRSPTMKLTVLPLLCFLCSLVQISTAQSCDGVSFSDGVSYDTCNDLPYLGAALHWTYHPSNGTVDVAYRAPQSDRGWVAWAINPTGRDMVGANAFLAFHSAAGVVTVYTTQFSGTEFPPSSVADQNLTFAVHSRRAEYSADGGYYTIYASLDLPGNRTTQNTVWQASTSFTNGVPFRHDLSGDNVMTMSSVDFLSGQASSSGGVPRLRRKNTHGVVNAISWGILLPVGAIIARYVKVFKSADPAWFYLHVSCQCSAYIVGLSGWILGLQLGSDSKGITYHKHRNLGIAIFTLATVQVFALFARPNKDHKHRLYWNIYHHAVGYGIILMSIINIFEGFDVLDPAKKWKRAYIAIVATLAGVALVLEVLTWPIVIRRRNSDKATGHAVHVANGYA